MVFKKNKRIALLLLFNLLVGVEFLFYKYTRLARMTDSSEICTDIYPFRISYVHHGGLWQGRWVGETVHVGAPSEKNICHITRKLSLEFLKIPPECLQKTVEHLILAGELKSFDRVKRLLGFCTNKTKTIAIHVENRIESNQRVFFHELAHLILNSDYMTAEDKKIWIQIPHAPTSFISQHATTGIEEDMAETLSFVLSTPMTHVPDNEMLTKKLEIAIRTRRSWCPQMN